MLLKVNNTRMQLTSHQLLSEYTTLLVFFAEIHSKYVVTSVCLLYNSYLQRALLSAKLCTIFREKELGTQVYQIFFIKEYHQPCQT